MAFRCYVIVQFYGDEKVVLRIMSQICIRVNMGIGPCFSALKATRDNETRERQTKRDAGVEGSPTPFSGLLPKPKHKTSLGFRV